MEISTANKWKLGVAAVFTALLITFIVQNMQVIEVNFLFAKLQIRRSLMILMTFAIGVSLGWVLRSIRL